LRPLGSLEERAPLVGGQILHFPNSRSLRIACGRINCLVTTLSLGTTSRTPRAPFTQRQLGNTNHSLVRSYLCQQTHRWVCLYVPEGRCIRSIDCLSRYKQILIHGNQIIRYIEFYIRVSAANTPSCYRDQLSMSLQGLSSSFCKFPLSKGCLTRLPTKNVGLEIQAKVCNRCGQLVLTYPQTMSCIVCGGPLKLVKSSH